MKIYFLKKKLSFKREGKIEIIASKIFLDIEKISLF